MGAMIRDWLKRSPRNNNFEALLDIPILLHFGKNNPKLNPTTEDGPGKSPWGAPDASFWQMHSGGPFGWRILSSSDLFDMVSKKATDLTVLSKLITDSGRIYKQFSVQGQGLQVGTQ